MFPRQCGSANHRTPPMRYPCGANRTAIVMHDIATTKLKWILTETLNLRNMYRSQKTKVGTFHHMVQTICVPYRTHCHCRCSWITHHRLTVEHLHSLILLFHLVPVSVLISLVLIVFCVLCLFFDPYSLKRQTKRERKRAIYHAWIRKYLIFHNECISSRRIRGTFRIQFNNSYACTTIP